MTMAMTQHTRMSNRVRNIREELRQQNLARIQAHKHAPEKQEAADAQRADAFDLAVAVRKPLGWRLERQRDRAEGQEIGNQVGERVVGVGDESLRVEDVATNKLADGHGEVGDEADSRDADAGVELVGRGEVGIAAVVVVVASVAGMGSCLRGHLWECGG